MKLLICSRFGASTFLYLRQTPNDFDTFSEDDLPSNSDVLLIIELYLEAFHRYRINNTTQGSWDIEREWKMTKSKKK